MVPVYCPEASDSLKSTSFEENGRTGLGMRCCVSGYRVCSWITEVRIKTCVAHLNGAHMQSSLEGGHCLLLEKAVLSGECFPLRPQGSGFQVGEK